MENNLTVFNSEVIPVYTTDTGEKVVLGRELHERLGIDTPYSKWFPRMVQYGFAENEDYSTVDKNVLRADGTEMPQIQHDHILTLDMAKHIAMIQRTPQGKAIRDKLIALETHISALSPQLQLLIRIETEQKRQADALEATNSRLDRLGEVIALNPNGWREDCRRMITRIALSMGGAEYIKDVQSEIFRLLDERFGVSLSTRLANLRRRMADEGACKSKRDKVSKVDVIAADRKLIEGYILIVKEMAIRHGVAA